MRSTVKTFFLSICTAGVILTMRPVHLHAQGYTTTKLKQHMEAAIKLQLKGEHKQALKELEQAYVLYPHPKILYYKGMSLFGLKNYAGAKVLLQSIKEDDRVKKKYGAMITQTITLCDEYLKTTKVSISTGILIGAAVKLEGAYVGETPLELTLGYGKHTLELNFPGYLPYKRTITCKGEASMTFTFAMQRKKKSQAIPDPIKKTSKKDDKTITPGVKKGGNTGAWLTLAGGGALILAGGGFLGRYLYDRSQIKDPLYNAQGTMIKEGDHVVKTNLYLSTALFTVGAGLTIWSLLKMKRRPPAIKKQITITPIISINGAGATITW